MDGVVGLEYIVEVRPVREGDPWYTCRLCDRVFSTTSGDEISNQRKLLRHLRMISHKLNFLQTHFPRVKRLMLEEPENKCTEEVVNRVVAKIERTFGHSKVRLVVGSETYNRSEAELDMVITKGAHFVEDDSFVESFRKKAKKRNKSRSKSRSKESKSKKRSRSKSPEKSKRTKTESPEQSKSKEVIMVLKKKEKVKRKNALSSSTSRSPSPHAKKMKKKSEDEKVSSNEKSKVKGATKQKKKKVSRRSSSSSSSRSRSSSPPSPSTLKVMDKIISKKRGKRRSESSPERKKSKKDKKSSKKAKPARERCYSSSPSPPKQSKLKKREKLDASRDTIKASLSNVEERVKKFKQEETEMFEELRQEQEKFYQSPSTHPQYQTEWNLFWKTEHEKLSRVTMVGGAEVSKIIEAKWVAHWKDFFDKSHESKMQERRKSLMALNRISIAEIEEIMLKQKPADEVITLDDSSDEDNGNRDIANEQNNQSRNVSKPVDTVKSSSVDASLLSTLRLLASLDTGGNLGEGMGIKLGQLQEAALTLEGSQFGSSEGLVRERDCSSFLDTARERLALRIDQGRIGPGQKQAARLALDNLEVLLRKFGVEREEVLEVDSVGVEEAAIRKRVELQLAGKVVSAQDMAALIEAERVRARLNLGPGLDAGLTSSGVAANLFSVYPSGQPTNPSQPEVWAAVSRMFNQPSSHQQQPQNFHLLQQAVREQQPSTSANAFSSDESSPPRSDITPSIIQEKPSSPSVPSSSSFPTKSPNRQSDIKAEPFESLTEEELIHLVKGFKDLDQKDKRDLIGYMKKLEKTNLAMVQRVKIGVSDAYFG